MSAERMDSEGAHGPAPVQAAAADGGARSAPQGRRGALPAMCPLPLVNDLIRALAVLVTGALVASACADRRTPDWTGVRAEEELVSVSVTSHHFLDVVVYANRNGSWQRLGTVTGLGSASLDVPPGLVSPPGQFRLRVHPIGASERRDYVSEVIIANPGDVIELTVASNLRMSSWFLRSSS